MSKDKAMQIFDGLMLGDSGLQSYVKGATFSMNLSMKTIPISDHLKWLQYIKDWCLEPLGVPISLGYPKELSLGFLKEPSRTRACLSSRTSPYLGEQYRRWYSFTGKQVEAGYRRGDTKIVPDDLVLTPVVLAHWFLGDGGSNWGDTGTGWLLNVALSTYGFTVEEVSRLTVMLNDMGIDTIKPAKLPSLKGSGLRMCLSCAGDNTDRFMDLVEPSILEIFGNSESPSYKDKVKRRNEPPLPPGIRSQIDQLRSKIGGKT